MRPVAPTLLQDLALVMGAAGIAVLLCHWLKQPAVLGYILAGVLVGPHLAWLPMAVSDEHSVHLLAQLGVVFLLFHIGLHFSVRGLTQVGWAAILASTVLTALMAVAGYWTGRLMGWSGMQSLFLGAILSISSTIVTVRLLTDAKQEHEPFARLILGILIWQDLLAVGLIAGLSTAAVSGSVKVGEVTGRMLGLGALLVLVLVAGLLVIPWLMRHVAKVKKGEALLVVVLALAFGAAVLTEQLRAGAAMGAFLTGAILAETPLRQKIEHLVTPLKHLFGAVFFVATGMLMDPRALPTLAFAIAILFAASVAFKILTGALGALVAGHDLKTSLRVGTGLVPIGEFSFIIAGLGMDLGVTDQSLYATTVAVALLSTAAGPWLMRTADPLTARLVRHMPPPAANLLRAYHAWFNQERVTGPAEMVRALLRKMAFQVGLNLVLVTGLFVGAILLAPWLEERWPAPANWPAALAWPRSGLLAGTCLIALPILIAALRKTRAAMMLLADFVVSRSAGRTPGEIQALRALLSHAGFGLALLAMGGWVLVLMLTLLPRWPVLLALLGVLGLAGFFLWHRMIQLYAGAQVAVRETLGEKAPEAEKPEKAESWIHQA